MDKKTCLLNIKAKNTLLNKEELIQAIKNYPAIELVDAMMDYQSQEIVALLLMLSGKPLAQFFCNFPLLRQRELAGHLPQETLITLFTHLAADDRVDLYHLLNNDRRKILLQHLPPEIRQDLQTLAAWPEDRVGAHTTSDFAWVDTNMQVDEALNTLRHHAPDKETIYSVYVMDDKRNLLGTVSLRQLVLARSTQRVSELMTHDPVRVEASAKLATSLELIRRYNLLALPVMDNQQKMLGIVTVDDAMESEHQQDATQLARFGGTATASGGDLQLRSSSLKRMYFVRVFWLIILTVFGVVTSNFVSAQEELLSEVIILAAFLAPIVDMGGNTGSQSATLVIRSLALGEVKVKWKDVGFVMIRELPIAIALGVTIAILESVLAWSSKGISGDILLVIGLSMMCCTVLGGLIGAILPFIARRIGTDPATLSSPLITSIMDLLGVVIYFGFAWMLLGDMLVG